MGKFDDSHPRHPIGSKLTLPLSDMDRYVWARNAAAFFIKHYAPYEFTEQDLTVDEPDEKDDPEDLKIAAACPFLLKEMGTLTRLIVAREFKSREEYAARMDSHMSGVMRDDKERREAIAASLAWPLIMGVRATVGMFISTDIAGQPSPVKYTMKWMSNWKVTKITACLRMRKAMFVAGKIAANDPPRKIYEVFSVERSNSYGIPQEAYAEMLSLGFTDIQERECASVLSKAAPSPLYLPDTRKFGSYSFTILAKDDWKNVTLGTINDSCMQPGNDAWRCIVDGITNPHSALMRISHCDIPVGHSWIRTGRSGTVYLDNVELVKEHFHAPDLQDALGEWCRSMRDELRRSVAVGKKYTALSLTVPKVQMNSDLYKSEFPDYDGYSDLPGSDAWIFEKMTVKNEMED